MSENSLSILTAVTELKPETETITGVATGPTNPSNGTSAAIPASQKGAIASANTPQVLKAVTDLKDGTEGIIVEKIKLDGPVLFTCYVDPNGIGDLGHFIDIANPSAVAKSCLAEDQPVIRFVMCAVEKKEVVLAKLVQAGMQDCTNIVFFKTKYLVESNDPIMKSINQSLTEVVHQQNLASLQDYLSKNSDFYARLKTTSAVVNVSTRVMEEYLPMVGISLDDKACVTIGEHGGAFSNSAEFHLQTQYTAKFDVASFNYLNNPRNRQMGFSLSHHGILLERTQTQLSKEECLSKIKSKAYLQLLLGSRDKALSANVSDLKAFLEQALLIPGYFQEGPSSFSVILQGVIASQVVQTSKYEEVIFSINSGNVELEKLDIDFLISHGVASIQHISIKNQKASSRKVELANKGRRIKIIEGFVMEKEDYAWLLKTAQIFYGCSGDKSFELALSNDLFPICQPRAHKTFFLENFISALKNFFPDLDLTFFDACSRLYKNSLSDKSGKIQMINSINTIASSLNVDLLVQWKTISDFIFEYYNFYDVLPLIFSEVLMCAKLKEIQAKAVTGACDEKLNTEINTLKAKLAAIEAKLSVRQQRIMDRLLLNLDKGQESLALASKFLAPDHFKQVFARLRTNTTLKKLAISDRSLCQVWPDLVKMLSANRMINELRLQGCFIDDKMTQELLTILQKRQVDLVCLDLSRNVITCQGMLPINQLLLAQKAPLELVLHHNQLGDKGIQLLSGILNRSSVIHLELANNKVGILGMKALTKALENNDTPLLELSILEDENRGTDYLLILRKIQELMRRNIVRIKGQEREEPYDKEKLYQFLMSVNKDAHYTREEVITFANSESGQAIINMYNLKEMFKLPAAAGKADKKDKLTA